MYYTIVAELRTSNGFMIGTLSKDHKFYQATNTALKFISATQASKYWREHGDIPCVGSIYILGPRNGYHSITCYRVDSFGRQALLNNPPVKPL